MRQFPTMALTLLLACSSTEPSDVWQDELNAARQRWTANGLSEYEYTYQFQCGFCPTEALRPMFVRVRDGEVIALYYQTFPSSEPPTRDGDWTIPEQFDRIQRYIDGGAKRLVVEYHAVNGVPVSVSVDPVPDAVDDEHGFTITAFGGIPIPAQR